MGELTLKAEIDYSGRTDSDEVKLTVFGVELHGDNNAGQNIVLNIGDVHLNIGDGISGTCTLFFFSNCGLGCFMSRINEPAMIEPVIQFKSTFNLIGEVLARRLAI